MQKTLVTTAREIRCALYTRKSVETGLEKEFNSLEAQREICLDYIKLHKHEGWVAIDKYYDDGGYSGANMDRPALDELIRDIKSGLINTVIVYKVDRISRSLLDFAKIMALFDNHNVSFVSVTQNFNTTNSMGKLILNILLSFAQFEREMVSERIRDKFHASAKKGMWMGGTLPLGYKVENRNLLINEEEAAIVRLVFEKFIELGSVTNVISILHDLGIDTKEFTTTAGKTKSRHIANKGYIYRLLGNQIYAGNIKHNEEVFQGRHEAIVSQECFDKVQAIFKGNSTKNEATIRKESPAILKGIISCGGCNSGMTPTYTKKKDKLYRYYIPNNFIKKKCLDCPVGHIAAGDIEQIVFSKLKEIFKSPRMILKTWQNVKQKGGYTEDQVIKALQSVHVIWDELFPKEQSRIVQLLIQKITIRPEGADIIFRSDGINTIVQELQIMEA